MPPHIYKADVAAGNVPFLYIPKYIEQKTIKLEEFFTLCGFISCCFFTSNFSDKYLFGAME